MTTKAPKLDLRFLVRMDKSHSGEYGKLSARIVFVDEGRVRHPSSTWTGAAEARHRPVQPPPQG